jgi:hypothetical protein
MERPRRIARYLAAKRLGDRTESVRVATNRKSGLAITLAGWAIVALGAVPCTNVTVQPKPDRAMSAEEWSEAALALVERVPADRLLGNRAPCDELDDELTARGFSRAAFDAAAAAARRTTKLIEDPRAAAESDEEESPCAETVRRLTTLLEEEARKANEHEE